MNKAVYLFLLLGGGLTIRSFFVNSGDEMFMMGGVFFALGVVLMFFRLKGVGN